MKLTGADFLALLPILIVTATSILVLLAVAVRRNHLVSAVGAFVGLTAAFVSLWVAAGAVPRQVTMLLLVDRYAVFYMGLILAAGMAFVVLAYNYFDHCEEDPDEVYILMLIATIGSMVLACSSHLIALFLGLELLSVALYGMIAYLRRRPLPLEAGIKYLVLAAVSSAFLLFGIALVYAGLGTMRFTSVAVALMGSGYARWLVMPGVGLIVTGFGFKLAVVPFHLWTPDVYQGAPAPVTAYIATVSKGAMFAVLLRYFYLTDALVFAPLHLVFTIIAIASMFAGNILALLQTNVKRLLAYSSIAHLGYLLVAFEAGGGFGAEAATFYLVAYFITTMGAFGIVSSLSGAEREAAEIEDYRGLFWRRPVLAAVFTAMLFSLAGIPLTAGFIGKFYVVAAGASSSLWPLIIILVVTSAIGLFYYLRVIVALYDRAPGREPRLTPAPAGKILLALLTILLIWLGVFPAPLLAAIHRALTGAA